MITRNNTLGIVAMALLAASSAGAVQINFTGGNVVMNDASTGTTNNSILNSNVDYYDEDGFRLDFEGGEGDSFTSNIGDYYSSNNDVIHGHWDTGDFGFLTRIFVTKIDGTAFDLNYFVLTSNTDTGGSTASGLENVRIHASLDGVTSSFSQTLVPENWGFPATQIFLGANFDGIKAFWFTADNAIDCFGMDEFFIDEAAPPPVDAPAGASLALLGLGGLAIARRARR